MSGIIVTGGSGFIGSSLVEYLLKKELGKKIINISKITYAVNPLTLASLKENPNYVFENMDIQNSKRITDLIRRYKVKQIYHLAAETHVDRSFHYPKEFLDSNVFGTFQILEAIRRLRPENRPRMIYMSTDEVFGDVPKGFCREDDKILPRNPYSASKASGEMYCHAYFHSFNLPVIIVRYMNNFGPRQHPEKLIPKIITSCLRNKHYSLFKGNSMRGWLYVKDTARILKGVMEKGNLGETYHTPPTEYQTVPQINNLILKLMKKKELFDGYKGSRLKDDERYALDGSKLRYLLKLKPNYSLEGGLRETIKWYRQNEWFWKSFLEKQRKNTFNQITEAYWKTGTTDEYEKKSFLYKFGKERDVRTRFKLFFWKVAPKYLRNKDKVLELGSSFGYLGAHFLFSKEIEFKYYPLDISEVAAKTYPRYFKALGLKREKFTLGDFTKPLPFPAHFFNVIWLIGWYVEELKPFKDWRKVLRECKRVLKNNGILIVDLPIRFSEERPFIVDEEELKRFLRFHNFKILFWENFAELGLVLKVKKIGWIR